MAKKSIEPLKCDKRTFPKELEMNFYDNGDHSVGIPSWSEDVTVKLKGVSPKGVIYTFDDTKLVDKGESQFREIEIPFERDGECPDIKKRLLKYMEKEYGQELSIGFTKDLQEMYEKENEAEAKYYEEQQKF